MVAKHNGEYVREESRTNMIVRNCTTETGKTIELLCQ